MRMIESVERQFCQPLVSGLGWCGYFAAAYAAKRSHKPLSAKAKPNQIISANKKISYQICSNELPSSPMLKVKCTALILIYEIIQNDVWMMKRNISYKLCLVLGFSFVSPALCFVYHHCNYSESVSAEKASQFLYLHRAKLSNEKLCNLWPLRVNLSKNLSFCLTHLKTFLMLQRDSREWERELNSKMFSKNNLISPNSFQVF